MNVSAQRRETLPVRKFSSKNGRSSDSAGVRRPRVDPSKRRAAQWFFANSSPPPPPPPPALQGGATDDEDEGDESPRQRRKPSLPFNVNEEFAALGVKRPDQRATLAAFVDRLPASEARVLVNLVRRACGSGFSFEHIRQVVESIVKLAPATRPTLVNLTTRLGKRAGMNGVQFTMLLDALRRVPFGQVADMVSLTLELTAGSEGVTVHQLARVVTRLLEIPSARRRSFVTSVRPWVQFRQLNVNQIEEGLENAVLIPELELEATVRRSVERMHVRQRSLTFRDQVDILQNEMLGSAQASNALAADVHSSDRDKRTGDAVKLLNQFGMASSETRKHVAACHQYVEKKLGNSELLDKLIDAVFEFNGTRHEGRDFVARLWHFAEAAPDAEEAKVGLVSGLVDSQHSCDHGKVQRLVIAVLQGRLAGVEIDRLDAVVNWTTYLKAFNFRHDKLMTAYMSVPKDSPQEAASLLALRVAADKFCISESIWFQPFWASMESALGVDEDEDEDED